MLKISKLEIIEKRKIKNTSPNERFHASGGAAHSRQVKPESIQYQLD